MAMPDTCQHQAHVRRYRRPAQSAPQPDAWRDAGGHGAGAGRPFRLARSGRRDTGALLQPGPRASAPAEVPAQDPMGARKGR